MEGVGFEPTKDKASRFTVCPRWPLGYPSRRANMAFFLAPGELSTAKAEARPARISRADDEKREKSLTIQAFRKKNAEFGNAPQTQADSRPPGRGGDFVSYARSRARPVRSPSLAYTGLHAGGSGAAPVRAGTRPAQEYAATGRFIGMGRRRTPGTAREKIIRSQDDAGQWQAPRAWGNAGQRERRGSKFPVDIEAEAVSVLRAVLRLDGV